MAELSRINDYWKRIKMPVADDAVGRGGLAKERSIWQI